MSIDITAAKEKILSIAILANEVKSAGIIGYKPDFREYGRVRDNDFPPTSRYWLYYSAVDTNSPQNTLGPIGRRLHETTGDVSLLVHAPMQSVDNLDKARLVAKIIRDAYRDTRDANVWFRNARILDQPVSEQKQYRVLVTVRYTFSERG